MLHSVTASLPDTVDVISYFLRRTASDADSTGFLTAVIPQLSALCETEIPQQLDAHTFRSLWEAAVARAAKVERHLLLVIDGLDEDFQTSGSASVASLLPDLVAGIDSSAAYAHVHVTSRPSLSLSVDFLVDPGHPLRYTAKEQLEGFPGWEELRDLGLHEIDQVVEAGQLPRHIMGFLAAAQGALTVSDLNRLIEGLQGNANIDEWEVEKAVRQAERSLDQSVVNGNTRYQFAHATLLEHAQKHQALNKSIYRKRLDDWADCWLASLWPPTKQDSSDTCLYLLDVYPTILSSDPERFPKFVADVVWIQAAIHILGVSYVLAVLRRAASLNNPYIAQLEAVVSTQSQELDRGYLPAEEGYVLRQLGLQSVRYSMTRLADDIRSRLEQLPSPNPIPVWASGTRPPALQLGFYKDGIERLAVTQQGNVVTASNDGRVLVWDLSGLGPTEVGRYYPEILAGCYPNSEGRIFVTKEDESRWTWDPKEYERLAPTVEGPARWINRALTSNGQLVVSYADGTLAVLDPDPPITVTELGYSNLFFRAAAIARDGRVITGGIGTQLMAWHPEHRGHPSLLNFDARFGHHSDWFWEMLELPNGRVAALQECNGVVICDLSGVEDPIILGPRSPGDDSFTMSIEYALAVTLDGKVVTGGPRGNGKLLIWDPTHPDEPQQIGFAEEGISALAVMPDGLIVTGGRDGRVLVWDPESPHNPTELGHHAGPVRGAAMLPGTRLVTGADDGRLLVWDLNHRSLPSPNHLNSALVVVTSKGQLITLDDYDAPLLLWDPENTREPIELGKPHCFPRASALPDGRVVTGHNDGSVLVWDLYRPGENRLLGQHGESVSAITSFPDGRVVTLGDRGAVLLWDLKADVSDAIVIGHHPYRTNLVRPDRTTSVVTVQGKIITAARDCVMLWDPAEPQIGHEFYDVPGSKLPLVATRDGSVLTLGSDGFIRLLDPSQPPKSIRFGKPESTVSALVSMPNGHVMTGGEDGHILVWDPQRPHEPIVIGKHSERIVSLVVSPEGFIIAAGSDNNILLFDSTEVSQPVAQISLGRQETNAYPRVEVCVPPATLGSTWSFAITGNGLSLWKIQID